MRMNFLKTALQTFFLFCILIVSVSGQGTEDVNIWNVNCTGDGSQCAISKELTKLVDVRSISRQSGLEHGPRMAEYLADGCQFGLFVSGALLLHQDRYGPE